ncbi:hypothetical protein [Chamaesiphon minutus]|uniref:hypothetical protein n=1 Tax=Chamaesiphon minutus TaxID=1173032 RepID=UPI0002D7E2EE|nr:hypothetical protein [Chamaesiphon minutus]
MKITYAQFQGKSRILQSLTGLNQQEFEKPRNGQLTEQQKEDNRVISNVRVEVDHQICGIKRCQIVVHKFRNLC